jgi:membrane-bound serine protease (ClpP class)
MNNAFRMALVLLVCMVAWGWQAAAEPNEPALPVRPPRSAKAAIIPCKGLIDSSLLYSIKRRTETALDEGADYLIYEISTYGGLVNAADDIAKYLIQEAAPRGHTVAYVATEAISAGAMISVSCRDIVMRENTTIGDAAPITMGGTLEGVEREKAESFVRATFQRAAEANGYPPLLLKAMVTMQTEVQRVRNLETGQYEFFETDDLPKDLNKYDVKGAQKIVGKDELLTLTASKALEYGIARAVVKDRAGALAFLEKRDGVEFTGEPVVLETTWSERMVSWLNSPGVLAVLIMLALLGAYVEFHTPGFGLAGTVAVICLAIIVGSKYLVGMANWVEVVVLFVGILLLLVEIFVLPGFGIAGVLGIVCILLGLFGMLIANAPDELPWPESPSDWQSLSSGVLSVALGFAGFIVLAWLVSRYLPRLGFLSGLVLTPAVPPSDRGVSQVSLTAPPQTADLGVRVGDVGEVVSRLRPAGKARFGEALVDVVATGEFLDRGTPVVIIGIYGSRVVVKKAQTDRRA